MVTGGEGCGRGIVREFGIDMYTLLYLKWITNNDQLYSTENCIQYLVMTYNGKETEKECIYACVHIYIPICV